MTRLGTSNMSAQGRLVIRRIGDEEAEKRVVAFLSSKTRNLTPDAVTAKLRSLPVVLASSIDAETGSRIAGYLQELGADAIFIPAATADDSLKEEPRVLSQMSFSPKRSSSVQEGTSATPQFNDVIKKDHSSGKKTIIWALSLLAVVAMVGTKSLFDHHEGGFGLTFICILVSPFLIVAALLGRFDGKTGDLIAKVLIYLTIPVILFFILQTPFTLVFLLLMVMAAGRKSTK